LEEGTNETLDHNRRRVSGAGNNQQHQIQTGPGAFEKPSRKPLLYPDLESEDQGGLIAALLLLLLLLLLPFQEALKPPPSLPLLWGRPSLGG